MKSNQLVTFDAAAITSATEPQLAAAIQEKLALFDNNLRSAGMIKACVGVFLVLVKERLGHGEFGAFLENRFSGRARTMRNWMKAVELFCDEQGITDSAKAAKLAPIVEVQLELWNDPAAKLAGIAKKFAAHFAGMSLRALLGSDEHAARQGPPARDGKRGKAARSKTLQNHGDAVADAKELRRILAAKSWQHLDADELQSLALVVRNAADAMAKQIKTAAR